jgi:hypothetical protein
MKSQGKRRGGFPNGLRTAQIIYPMSWRQFGELKALRREAIADEYIAEHPGTDPRHAYALAIG